MSEGGSYIREKDGSLTLVQRTEEAKAATIAALEGASSSPAAGADGTAASAQPGRSSNRPVRKEA